MFNPAAAAKDGRVHLLYRAVGSEGQFLSQLGLAVSDDGIVFERASADPVFHPEQPYERWSIEDPRMVDAGDRFLLTYVVLTKPALTYGQRALTALASSRDLRSFTRHGIISPMLDDLDDRNTVLFPEPVRGEHVMLRRPQRLAGSDYVEYGTGGPSSIWISCSDDLERWGPGRRLLRPEQWWETRKIGAGPPPVRTERGWLALYHGVDQHGVYRGGAALLDLEHPDRVIARLPYPILEPEEEYEKVGVTPNVVFPEATASIDGRLLVYYGAADTVCAVAGVEVTELLDALAQHPTGAQ